MPLRLSWLIFLCCVACCCAHAAEPVNRERLSMDQGWRFYLGDIPFPEVKGHDPSYLNAKAGRANGAAAPDFDDTDWQVLDLPHDWAVEGNFDENANLSQGYRRRGVGWYRRQFKLDPSDRGRHLELQFDGVATHATVWVNGTVLHRNWCGYTSFYLDITPLAQFGDNLNTVAVRVDADAMEGWWYEGAGIYRHTWMVKRDRVHLITDGVFANPVREADGQWRLPVEATLENTGRDEETVEVEAILIDPDGKVIGRAHSAEKLTALEQTTAKLSLPVVEPRLWSVDRPVLYRLRTIVQRAGLVVDEVTTPCGFRTIRFDPDQGIFLNDQPLKLQGVCNHQDHAGVGVAVPDSLWEFRLRKLKEMGVNAYRCAHNPPSAEFLDACDRQGILVMDENRNFNTGDEYQRQLAWLVRRDRNHPSVILWSVFNEEPMQGTDSGYEMVRRMVAVVKRLDSTRPVTAAMNGGLFNPVNVSQAVDVVGFNYQIDAYDRFHAANPKLPLTSSEDTSALMTRGEYITDENRHVKDSYDTQRAKWGATHRDAWKAIATRPYLAGGFVWTGFDYRGEPTPYQWPSAGSLFGTMDLCGFPKTAYFLHQAQWIKDRPVLQLVPHWNWAGREGNPIKVMALSNADTVALSLNGVSLGEKPVDPYEMVSWSVPYEPGKLEAIAKKAGQEVMRQVIETTGVPAALHLTPDRSEIAGDGWDALPVTVEALDAQGRPVPTANLPVEFDLSGPGAIIGVGNGDPNCHEPEKGNRRSLFNGLAQVIVQSRRGETGFVLLRAKSDGLRTAEITIPVQRVAARASVSVAQRVFSLQLWRMSPVTEIAPDPNQELADSDQNSWQQVQPGKLQSFAGGRYAIYRTSFKPFKQVQRRGGRLVFHGTTGRTEVWLDRRPVGTKSQQEDASLIVPVPAGDGQHTLSVVIETSAGRPAGFSGEITIENLPFDTL